MKKSDVIKLKKGLKSCCADECHGKHSGCPYTSSALCMMEMANDALSYINQLEHRLASVGKTCPEWISVYDRLPEIGTVVLGYAKQNPFSAYDVMRVRNLGNGFEMIRYHEYASSITYWMPLPEMPKEE